MKRKLLCFIAACALITVLMPGLVASAATTADVTVQATPEYIDITCNVSTYNYGNVATSVTINSTTTHFGITNSSSIQTDETISVTTSTWSGGATWTHDDGGSPGADTAALLSNRGGTWGTGDVIVKNASPNYIYENCPSGTDYDFGLGLHTPTSFSDGVQKQITLRIIPVLISLSIRANCLCQLENIVIV